MGLTNTDILFASLVGSKVNIPRFRAVQNELMKHVLPPIPFLPLKKEVKPKAGETGFDDLPVWRADNPLPAQQQFFPLWFELDGKKWLFPYEPMISISGKHTVVKRNVAKAHSTKNNTKKLTGSIKEYWNQGDYEITITGALIGSILTGDVSECFPRKDFEKLRAFLTAGRRIKVQAEPFQLLGIDYIVIEDFSFPFTKGENVQAYEIKAYSDFDYELLLEIND